MLWCSGPGKRSTRFAACPGSSMGGKGLGRKLKLPLVTGIGDCMFQIFESLVQVLWIFISPIKRSPGLADIAYSMHLAMRHENNLMLQDFDSGFRMSVCRQPVCMPIQMEASGSGVEGGQPPPPRPCPQRREKGEKKKRRKDKGGAHTFAFTLKFVLESQICKWRTLFYEWRKARPFVILELCMFCPFRDEHARLLI